MISTFLQLRKANRMNYYERGLAFPQDNAIHETPTSRDIFEMSCEKGFKAIIDDAKWQIQTEPDKDYGFIEALSAESSHYHHAMLI